MIDQQQPPADPVELAATSPRRVPIRRPSTLLVLFPLAFVAVVFAYPVAEMFRLSFTDIFGNETWRLGNYHWYLTDPVQMRILRRTLIVSVSVTMLCLALGFPYAYLMTRVGPRARLLMLGAVLLPFWSNLVVRMPVPLSLLAGGPRFF